MDSVIKARDVQFSSKNLVYPLTLNFHPENGIDDLINLGNRISHLLFSQAQLAGEFSSVNFSSKMFKAVENCSQLIRSFSANQNVVRIVNTQVVEHAMRAVQDLISGFLGNSLERCFRGLKSWDANRHGFAGKKKPSGMLGMP